MGFFSNIAKGFKNFIPKIIKGIKGALPKIAKGFKGAIPKITKGLKRIINPIKKGIQNLFKSSPKEATGRVGKEVIRAGKRGRNLIKKTKKLPNLKSGLFPPM